jgi:putative NIF3 family GTP cyclohydrolase 1 type 2
VTNALTKKNMLHSLCKGLLDKNYELYLKHETMLDDERVARQGLAEQFGDRMKEVQAELDEQKAKRGAEIEENTRLRGLIQAAINEYKVKEETYRGKIEVHDKAI